MTQPNLRLVTNGNRNQRDGRLQDIVNEWIKFPTKELPLPSSSALQKFKRMREEVDVLYTDEPFCDLAMYPFEGFLLKVIAILSVAVMIAGVIESMFMPGNENVTIVISSGFLTILLLLFVYPKRYIAHDVSARHHKLWRSLVSPELDENIDAFMLYLGKDSNPRFFIRVINTHRHFLPWSKLRINRGKTLCEVVCITHTENNKARAIFTAWMS